jgi:nucleotide-binding universal stress UspA family protein
MSRHILVAFDESPQSESALEHALRSFSDATITAVHVNDPHEWLTVGDEFDSFYSEVSYDRVQEAAQDTLSRAEEIAADHDREIKTEAVTGKPSNEIINYAQNHDVDHIVLGSHGRTGLDRFLIGSVAERVVRRSPVPVTVMRGRHEQE